MSPGRLLENGDSYQIVANRNGGSILLLDEAAMPPSPALTQMIKRAKESEFAGRKIRALAFAEDNAPLRVGSIERRAHPVTSSELAALVSGLQRMSEETPNASWQDAIFLVSDAMCIPVSLESDRESHRTLAVRILTGGIAEQRLSPSQIKARTLWLTLEEVEAFLHLCGEPLGTNEEMQSRARTGSPFHLAGQPEFSRIVNEYVVDYQRNPDRYKDMGVRMPNGILLYGPQGSGKTFALRKLASFLSWHVTEVTLGGVGSPYIHQTSSRFRKLFLDAEATKPTLIIMNEIDALAPGRTNRSDDHKVEEINELLGLVESAAARGILVAGTTNRREAIDRAFLRKGRFDLEIEMKYPDKAQAIDLLHAIIGERPKVAGLNIETAARQLAGRPTSDIEWVVNEAARLAAKSGKDAIDDVCLFNALGRLRNE